jgi:uncharacterized protein
MDGMATSTVRATTTDLWDWRRRVGDLYGAVRAARDPREGWAQWRATRDQLFAGHPQTPLEPAARAAFRGLPYFPYEPALRLAVGLDDAGDAPPAAMDVGRDGTVALAPFARTRGLAGPLGAELTLYWIGGYGGGVFLPFRDGTSGSETFAGGRYLLDTIKGADLGQTRDGALILDFNFAYNPSCSYSDAWVCPLAPPGNRLSAAVRAGEKVAQSAS